MPTARLSTFYPSDVFSAFVSNPELKQLVGVITTPTGEKPAVSYKSERPEAILSISKIELVINDRPDDVFTALMDSRTKRERTFTVNVAAFGGDLEEFDRELAAYYGIESIEKTELTDGTAYAEAIDGAGVGGVTAAATYVLTLGPVVYGGSSEDIEDAPATGTWARQEGEWVAVEIPDIEVPEAGPVDYVELVDVSTEANVRLSARDGALVITDPFKESVSQIDLGGTTPDPGNIANVFIDGTGKYSVGASTLNNANGVITLEYINAPGQFFVINDIDGSVFGPGDRQSFGLVAEDIVDRTNLRGGVAPLSGGNAGGWSSSYSWYYTGGYPYAWTTYVTQNQTPGQSGLAATGPVGSQIWQKKWWELATKAGVGKSYRVGIANGTLTDQSGQNFTTRLVHQLYYSQEMVDHPDFSTLAPGSVQTGGVGWYTHAATAGEFENLGQFADGNDKGYRFRWSTFGNTSLNQLPYVTGVSNNDQITSASGQSHYVVYNCVLEDAQAANAQLANGLLGANNRLYPESTTVDILQFNQPYDWASAATDEANVFELKYTYLAAVLASPLFNQYQITTVEEITETAVSVAPLEKLHASVCTEVLQAVTAFYMVLDLNPTQTQQVNSVLEDCVQAALSGQLITTYDAVNAVATDASLFPAALKTAILEKLAFWMATLPDN